MAPSAVAVGDGPRANRSGRWLVGGVLAGWAHGGVGSGFESAVVDEDCADRAALEIALIAWLGDGWLLA